MSNFIFRKKFKNSQMNIYKKAQIKQEINHNFDITFSNELQLGQKSKLYLTGDFMEIFKQKQIPESTMHMMIIPFDLKTKTYNIDEFFLADNKIYYLTTISLSKIRKSLSQNCKLFYYDLHRIYRKRSFIEQLCSCIKDPSIVKEYDAKILTRHCEIEYNLAHHFKSQQSKFGFEIKTGYMSAWIEISHPFINLTKFNKIQFADVHILKKYYSSINDKRKDRKRLFEKDILCRIVSHMDLINEYELEMISINLNTYGTFKKVQRYLNSKFGNTTQNELSPDRKSKRSKTIHHYQNVKDYIKQLIDTKYEDKLKKSAVKKNKYDLQKVNSSRSLEFLSQIKKGQGKEIEKFEISSLEKMEDLKDFVGSILPNHIEYITEKEGSGFWRPRLYFNTILVNPGANTRNKTETNTKKHRKEKITYSYPELIKEYANFIIDEPLECISLVIENNFMENFFDQPTRKLYIDPNSITQSEKMINIHHDQNFEILEDRKAEYKRNKADAIRINETTKRIRVFRYDMKRLKNIYDSFSELIKKHGTEPNQDHCFTVMNDTFDKIINSFEYKKQSYISKEEQTNLTDILQTLTNIFMIKKKANRQMVETDLQEEEELTSMFSEIINKIKCEIIRDIFVTKDEFSALIDMHNELYGILYNNFISMLKVNWSLSKANKLFNNIINEINKKNKNTISEKVQILTNEQGNLIEIFRNLVEAVNKISDEGINKQVQCDLKKMNGRFYQIINKDKLEDNTNDLFSYLEGRLSNSVKEEKVDIIKLQNDKYDENIRVLKP